MPWFLALLVSLAALRAGGLPKGLNILGLLVGAAGITSIIPGLTEVMVGIFGLSQIIWFVWLGIVLLRNNPAGQRNTNSLFDFKFQQQTRVLERLTLSLSNFEK